MLPMHSMKCDLVLSGNAFFLEANSFSIPCRYSRQAGLCMIYEKNERRKGDNFQHVRLVAVEG